MTGDFMAAWLLQGEGPGAVCVMKGRINKNGEWNGPKPQESKAVAATFQFDGDTRQAKRAGFY